MNPDSTFPIIIKEYSLSAQLFYTGLSGYITIILFILSISVLILSWLNYFKFHKNIIFTFVLYSVPLILISAIFNNYFHSIVLENTISSLINNSMIYNVDSDLVLRGFYLNRIIARYQLYIGIITLLSFYPIIKSKINK